MYGHIYISHFVVSGPAANSISWDLHCCSFCEQRLGRHGGLWDEARLRQDWEEDQANRVAYLEQLKSANLNAEVHYAAGINRRSPLDDNHTANAAQHGEGVRVEQAAHEAQRDHIGNTSNPHHNFHQPVPNTHDAVWQVDSRLSLMYALQETGLINDINDPIWRTLSTQDAQHMLAGANIDVDCIADPAIAATVRLAQQRPHHSDSRVRPSPRPHVHKFAANASASLAQKRVEHDVARLDRNEASTAATGMARCGAEWYRAASLRIGCGVGHARMLRFGRVFGNNQIIIHYLRFGRVFGNNQSGRSWPALRHNPKLSVNIVLIMMTSMVLIALWCRWRCIRNSVASSEARPRPSRQWLTPRRRVA